MAKWKVTFPNGDRVGRVINGNCVDVLKSMDSDSVDSIITDPPYEIGFMGKGHDKTGIAYDTDMWAECLRVLKPGGHLLSFGAPKTYHRMAVAVEDAGFEIRDSIFWCYGSGFPKSLNVSKAIDKAAGAKREVVGLSARHGGGIIGNGSSFEISPEIPTITAPATDAAKQWDGWGTALKPAVEPIVVARKPLSEKTVAKNILKHGTGAINVDGTRVGEADGFGGGAKGTSGFAAGYGNDGFATSGKGRWPANLMLGHSESCKDRCADDCPVTNLDGQGDGASRFFHAFQMDSPLVYQSKANKKERPTVDGTGHSTVKPLDLMRNLVRLVTPPDGIVLDPFGGSGTTGEAALLEDVVFILIEKEQTYIPLIKQRMERNGYCVKQVAAIREALGEEPK